MRSQLGVGVSGTGLRPVVVSWQKDGRDLKPPELGDGEGQGVAVGPAGIKQVPGNYEKVESLVVRLFDQATEGAGKPRPVDPGRCLRQEPERPTKVDVGRVKQLCSGPGACAILAGRKAACKGRMVSQSHGTIGSPFCCPGQSRQVGRRTLAPGLAELGPRDC